MRHFIERASWLLFNRWLPALLLSVISSHANAAITFIGAGTVMQSTTSGTKTVVCPVAQAGDLRLLALESDGGGAVPTPSGWTDISGGVYVNHKIFAHVATGSDTNPSFNPGTTTAQQAQCSVFRGVDTTSLGSVVDVSGSATVSSQTILRVPAATPTNAGELAFFFGSSRNGWTSVATPASFTEIADAVVSSNAMAVDYWIQTTATAVAQTDLAITGNGSQSTQLGILLFLKAAAGGGGSGATFTICDSGCDYLNTTAGFTAAIAAMNPGDILEMRTTPAGSAETWASRIVCSNKDGTAGNELTIRVRDGDSVTLSTSTGSTDALVEFNGCDYWIIQGNSTGTGGLKIGDRSLWANGCAQNYNCYPQKVTLKILNSTHLRLSGFEASGASTYEANIIDRASNSLLLDRCLFDLHGSNHFWDGAHYVDSGNLTAFLATRLIVEDCTFSHGGHINLHNDGPYQVYRRIVGDGTWVDKNTGSPGNHAATFDPGRSYLASTFGPPPTEFGPLLVEDSIFKNADVAADAVQGFNTGMKLDGVGVIFRGNYFWDTASGAHIANCGTVDTTKTALSEAWESIYNNTMYGGAVLFATGFGYPATVDSRICEKPLIVNNVFQGVVDNKPSSHPEVFNYDIGANNVPFAGYANAWKGGYIAYNIFGGTSSNMEFRLTGSGGATVAITDCSTWSDATVPGGKNVCNNLNSVLTFANGTTNPTRSKIGFALHPSNTVGLGDAINITTTTDAGTADTTLTLAWARPFKDDWGMGGYTWGGHHTEYGDCIAVGPATSSTATQAVVTRITSIDYTTRAIVVTPGVTHVAGSKVWKATDNGNGTCGSVWDNRGAVQ